MSAPNTDIETQEKRHKGPLTGMRLAVLAVAALFVVFLAIVVGNGDTPGTESGVAAETAAPATN